MSSQNSTMSSLKKGSMSLKNVKEQEYVALWGSQSSILNIPTQVLPSQTAEEEDFADEGSGGEGSGDDDDILETHPKLVPGNPAYYFENMIPQEFYHDAFLKVLNLRADECPRKFNGKGVEVPDRLNSRTFSKTSSKNFNRYTKSQKNKFLAYWGRLRVTTRDDIAKQFVNPARNAAAAVATAAATPSTPALPSSAATSVSILQTPIAAAASPVSSLSASSSVSRKAGTLSSVGYCSGYDKHDCARLLHLFVLPSLAPTWARIFGGKDRQTLDAMHSKVSTEDQDDLDAWVVIQKAFNNRYPNTSNDFYFDNAAVIAEPGTANWQLRPGVAISARLASHVYSLDPCATRDDKGQLYVERHTLWVKALWWKLKPILAQTWNNWNRSGQHSGDASSAEGRDSWVDFCAGNVWLMYAIVVFTARDFEDRIGHQISAGAGGRTSAAFVKLQQCKEDMMRLEFELHLQQQQADLKDLLTICRDPEMPQQYKDQVFDMWKQMRFAGAKRPAPDNSMRVAAAVATRIRLCSCDTC